MKISACLIVGNEAANIIGWLKSVRCFADEILLIDTGATDDTIALANQEKIPQLRMSSFFWQDDFAAAKNKALSLATGDWVVFLDADETFFQPKAVREYLQDVAREVEGVLVPICNVDTDANDQEISRFPALRIWRNRPTFRFQGVIHEALYDNGQPLKNIVFAAPLEVRHTGYSSNIIRTKLERNLRILQREIEEQGEQPRYYRHLAECCLGLGEAELALYYAQRAIEEEPATVAGKNGLYHTMLQAMELLDKTIVERMHWVDIAMEKLPEPQEFLPAKAKLLSIVEDWLGVKSCVEDFFSYEEKRKQNLTGTSYATAQLPQMLAWAGKIALLENDLSKAEKLLCQSLQINPYQENALTYLEELCYRQGKDVVKAVLSYLPDNGVTHAFLEQWVVNTGNMDMARQLHFPLPLCQEVFPGNAETVYRQAINEGTDRYIELFVNLLMADCTTRDYVVWSEILPEGIANVLDRLTGKREKLLVGDYEAFKAVVLKMRGITSKDILSRLAKVAFDFEPDCIRQMAKVFLDGGCYAEALALYEKVPAEMVDREGAFWYEVGKCLFHLQNQAAAECLARARENGCQEPDIEAYLAWLPFKAGEDK